MPPPNPPGWNPPLKPPGWKPPLNPPGWKPPEKPAPGAMRKPPPGAAKPPPTDGPTRGENVIAGRAAPTAGTAERRPAVPTGPNVPGRFAVTVPGPRKPP